MVDSNNVISAKLQTEISQIDPSVSYGGMPGFLTRRTESDVSIRAGETLAISGLVSADASDMASKLPFLGQIPILGRLFRSDDFRAKKSDLVIFVTPLISDPSQPGQEPNAGLMSRASQIDENYRSRYGDPSPLSVIKPDGQRAKAVPVEAAPVEEAGKPAPAPLQAPWRHQHRHRHRHRPNRRVPRRALPLSSRACSMAPCRGRQARTRHSDCCAPGAGAAAGA